MAAEFSLGENGEYTFKVSNLKVKTSLLISKKLAKALLPAIAEAARAPDGQIGNAVQRVVENLDSLDDLLDAFVAVTQATWPGRENPTELKNFVDHVFGGRPEMLLEYLVRCVQGEHGRFLSGNGLLAPFLAKAKSAGLLG